MWQRHLNFQEYKNKKFLNIENKKKHQIRKIYKILPKLFNKKIYDKIEELKKINDAYISMPMKDFGRALASSPYVFELPNEQIRENMRVLRKHNFGSSYIHKLV